MSTFSNQLFAHVLANGLNPSESNTSAVQALVAGLVGNATEPVGYEDRLEWYKKILHICMNSDDPMESIARIVGGIIIADPGEAYLWLDVLKGPLAFGAEPNTDIGQNRMFAFGAVIGLFQAIVWLDARNKTSRHLESQFICAIEAIIFSSSSLIPADDQYDKVKPSTAEYDAPLSAAVKAWASREHKQKGPSSGVGERIARVMDLLSSAHRDILAQKPKKRISKFGCHILDEINYALFKSISTEGRTRALALLIESVTHEALTQKCE